MEMRAKFGAINIDKGHRTRYIGGGAFSFQLRNEIVVLLFNSESFQSGK